MAIYKIFSANAINTNLALLGFFLKAIITMIIDTIKHKYAIGASAITTAGSKSSEKIQ